MKTKSKYGDGNYEAYIPGLNECEDEESEARNRSPLILHFPPKKDVLLFISYYFDRAGVAVE